MKRAKYFITCNGKYFTQSKLFNTGFITENLLFLEKLSKKTILNSNQLSLFDNLKELPTMEDKIKCLSGNI